MPGNNFAFLVMLNAYGVSMIASWSALQSSIQPLVYVNKYAFSLHANVVQESWTNLSRWAQLKSKVNFFGFKPNSEDFALFDT